MGIFSACFFTLALLSIPAVQARGLLKKTMTVEDLMRFYATRAAHDPTAAAKVQREFCEHVLEDYEQHEILDMLAEKYPQAGSAGNILNLYGTGPPERELLEAKEAPHEGPAKSPTTQALQRATAAVAQPHNTGGASEEGSIKMKAPQLSEEEQQSVHVPARMRCDACTAVAYNLYESLARAEKMMPKSKQDRGDPLGDLEVLEVIDNVCRGPHWDQLYGVKGDNKLLTGPGLASSEGAGVVLGGGIWARRLSSMCAEITGEESEEEFYTQVFLPYRPRLTAGGPADGETVQRNGDFLRSMCVEKTKLCTAKDADAAAQYWFDVALKSHSEGKNTEQSHQGRKKKKKKRSARQRRKNTRQANKRKRTGKRPKHKSKLSKNKGENKNGRQHDRDEL